MGNRWGNSGNSVTLHFLSSKITAGGDCSQEIWASFVAQRIKHLPAMQETQVQSLSWEDPLEKEMATHSSIPAWRIPWTEEPGGLQSTGLQRVGHNWATSRPVPVAPWKESYDQPRQHVKKQRHYFANKGLSKTKQNKTQQNKGLSSQGSGFSCSHVWMWELDNKESWAPKNWCFWTAVLEKIVESARRSNQSILKEISPEYSLDFEQGKY